MLTGLTRFVYLSKPLSFLLRISLNFNNFRLLTIPPVEGEILILSDIFFIFITPQFVLLAEEATFISVYQYQDYTIQVWMLALGFSILSYLYMFYAVSSTDRKRPKSVSPPFFMTIPNHHHPSSSSSLPSSLLLLGSTSSPATSSISFSSFSS